MRMLLVGFVFVFVLAGCAQTGAAPDAAESPTGSTSDSTEPSTTAPTSSEEAKELLASAVLPADAVRAPQSITHAAQTPACDPLIDLTSNWFVPGESLDSIAAFLAAHPAPHLGSITRGTLSGPAGIVSKNVTDESPTDVTRTLVFNLKPARGGVDVRVDAQVIPWGSSCARSAPGEGASTDSATVAP